jgi:hypothetical protein
MSPEMLAILARAAATPAGEIVIVRPREGVWPDELHLIRLLEKNECLRRVRVIDSPGDGTFTAVYALTPNGAKLAAELRKADLSAKEAPGVGPRAAGPAAPRKRTRRRS